METKIPTLELAVLKDMASYENQPNKQLLMKNANGMVVLVALKRGQNLPRHLAPEDALALCVEGRAVFSFDQGDIVVAAGDYFTMDKNTAHTVSAIEDTKIMLNIFKK